MQVHISQRRGMYNKTKGKGVPKTHFQVPQPILLKVVNNMPCVRGPAKTAGASAMKHDNLSSSSGRMPSESEINPMPFPWEWPMNAICNIQDFLRMNEHGHIKT